MSFIAEYHGACDDCGGDMMGREVQYDQLGELVHVKCPETDVDVPKGVPYCGRCFQYHNGECL